MNAETIGKLKTQLIKHEGSSLKPYTDTAGKITIGVGRNLTDVGITDGELLLMLNNDISRTLNDLITHLPFFAELDETRQLVLADMAFNLGIHGLLQFHRMLTAIEDMEYAQAAEEMLKSKWAQQVGQRAKDLAQQIQIP